MEQPNRVSSSFIGDDQPNICVRILRKVDIFSFIPVPKDDTVSTKASLIGTAVFFIIFLTYIIFDFVKFVNNNPPSIQSYRTPLDDKYYTLPSFGIAFMTNNPNYDQTDFYDDFLTYNWSTKVKTMGTESTVPIGVKQVTYLNGTETNFNSMPWMSDDVKKFYQILRTPDQPLKARGLLFSTPIAIYPSFKLNFCSDHDNLTCLKGNDFYKLTNYGRIFMFIEQMTDNSSVSKDQINNDGNKYLQYNFFLIQGFFKRVTIQFQVVVTEVLPDYFWRFTTEKTEFIQLDVINEQMSKVDSLDNNKDAIAFNFMLSPSILNNRVAYTTLIDHISLWGATWGVLFAIFAIFFLSYNRRKFY